MDVVRSEKPRFTPESRAYRAVIESSLEEHISRVGGLAIKLLFLLRWPRRRDLDAFGLVVSVELRGLLAENAVEVAHLLDNWVSALRRSRLGTRACLESW